MTRRHEPLRLTMRNGRERSTLSARSGRSRPPSFFPFSLSHFQLRPAGRKGQKEEGKRQHGQSSTVFLLFPFLFLFFSTAIEQERALPIPLFPPSAFFNPPGYRRNSKNSQEIFFPFSPFSIPLLWRLQAEAGSRRSRREGPNTPAGRRGVPPLFFPLPFFDPRGAVDNVQKWRIAKSRQSKFFVG